MISLFAELLQVPTNATAIVDKSVENPSVTLTALGICLGAVYYRLSNLESKTDREQYLNDRLSGRQWFERPLKMECDDIRVIESSGIFYAFKKYGLGRFEGESSVSVIANFTFDEGLRDTNLFEPVAELGYNIEIGDVEVLNQEDVQIMLVIDTADKDELMKSIAYMMKTMDYALENIDGFSLGKQYRPQELD
ncbi:hypothetical protein [Haloarcula laminariae]|uniref:hypothetical protein n=1 Tax=Haloarcula laminariae TaxID=2961577 RepID=UPI0021CA6BDF|nr:hypothetical protein [Halomicroarcula laminariae]